jgi:hypothetical protein
MAKKLGIAMESGKPLVEGGGVEEKQAIENVVKLVEENRLNIQ